MIHKDTYKNTLEAEFKKGILRFTVPLGLIITAFGISIMVMIGGYLIKYFRGAIPLREVSITKQASKEYVSFDINYVLESFMESYRYRHGVGRTIGVYYLVLDEELGAVPVRVSSKMEEQMDQIMEETWDYLSGSRSEPPQGIHVEGTMTELSSDGKTFFDEAAGRYELESENAVCYLWAGALESLSPPIAKALAGFGAVVAVLGLLILSSILKNKHIKVIQDFLGSHENVTREMLEEDFHGARKINNMLWMGDNYTYGTQGKPSILINQEIKKIWFRVQKTGRGSNQDLVFNMSDGKEHIFPMNRKKAENIIALYREKFPSLRMTSSFKGMLTAAEDGADEKGENRP